MREAIYRHEIEMCGHDALTVTFFADVLQAEGDSFYLCEQIAAVVYVGGDDTDASPGADVVGRQRRLADQGDEERLCYYFEQEAARLVGLGA